MNAATLNHYPLRALRSNLAGIAGKERRTPSGEGAAALLGVLAGGLEVMLWNYCRQEPLCAAPLKGIEGGLRANLCDSRFSIHPLFRFSQMLFGLNFFVHPFRVQGACQTILRQSLHFPGVTNPGGGTRCINAGHCAFEEHIHTSENGPRSSFLQRKRGLSDGKAQAAA